MVRKRKNYRLIALIVLTMLIYIVAFPMNEWLSATMPRHQLIQLPGILILGILLALLFPRLIVRDNSWGLAFLIFIMASISFWMLPHSIDYAVINKNFNHLMHLTMVISGILLGAVFRGILFEIKIIFLGMLSAMLIGVGVSLRSFDILLCSSFTIDQQQETGLYLILIGMLLIGFTLIWFFKVLTKSNLKPIAE